MEATPGQKIAPSVSHEACVIAEFSTDLAGLADYLSAVASDGDAEEMRLALRRAAAAIRRGSTDTTGSAMTSLSQTELP